MTDGLVVAVSAEQPVDDAESGVELGDGLRIVIDVLGQPARVVGNVS